MGGEVSGSQHHQPSGSNGSGVSLLMGSICLPPVLCIWQTAQILICVSLWGGRRLYPRSERRFPWLFLLFSAYPLPSLINHWLNLPFRIQGMKPTPCTQESGGTERPLYPGAPGSCSVSLTMFTLRNVKDQKDSYSSKENMQTCSGMFDSFVNPWTVQPLSSLSVNFFPGKNTETGCHFLLRDSWPKDQTHAPASQL